ncbi:MAG TPA: FAD-binding oxidoreductase [Candidatus Acidoferrum sp.]|jgi:glycolate oxidase FAD binding subunit
MSSSVANVAGRLESVIGAAHVGGEATQCEKYAIDGVIPAAVAMAASAEEVAEVVRFAAREKLALVPCGRCTKLGIGMPPARYDFALDVTGLKQIAYYDPADLTLSVDAGMGLGQLAEVLGEQKQFVPLTVPFFDECTVGGAVASGISSMLRHFYGTARDFLLGTEFVNGAGTLTKSGGRVVKNVTGYDLHKLLIGSLGTLAVITRLNFRTFPSPQGYGHLVAVFSDVDAIVQFRNMVAKSPLAPDSFEILGPEAARYLAEFKEDRSSPLPSWYAAGLWHVCVSFEGTEAVLRRYSTDLARFAQQSGAANFEFLDGPRSEALGGALRELLNLLVCSGPAVSIFKISSLPAFPADVVRLRELAERLSIPCVIFASASGPLYFAAQPPVLDGNAIGAMAQLASGVFEYATAHRGQASILFCPAELKRVVNVWGPERKDGELMRRVKKAFDPENVFAPGRFLAGI